MKTLLPSRPPLYSGLIFLVSLVLSLGFLLVLTRGDWSSVRAFALGPWSSAYFLGLTLDWFGLCGLAALGFLFSWEAGLFNLGGEGQIVIAAMVTGLLAPALAPLGALGIPLLLVLASLAGASLGLLAFLMKRSFSIPEIISTYLLSLICLQLAEGLYSGPLRNQAGNLLAGVPVLDSQRLPLWAPPSGLNPGILVFPVILVWWLLGLRPGIVGFEWRIMRSNAELAVSQGIRIGRRQALALGLGSGIHGLIGGLLVLGTHGMASPGISSGLAWSGITACLLVAYQAWFLPLGALYLAWLHTGFQTAVLQGNALRMAGDVIQGLIIGLAALQSGSLKPARGRKG